MVCSPCTSFQKRKHKSPDAEAEEREVQSHYLGNVLISAQADPDELMTQVKKTLANTAPNLVVNSIQRYSEVVHANFAQQRMIASLTWLFGAVGLALAAIGLYGVTAYGVEQRANEIGVRMALGAGRGSVVLMVLREAFGQVGIGLALGIPAAIGRGISWLTSSLMLSPITLCCWQGRLCFSDLRRYARHDPHA